MASLTSSSEHVENKNIIKLNVSGERMSTTLATLTAFPDSVLGHKFQFFIDSESRYGKPLTDDDDAVFIDSDPQAFRVILNYLRRGRFVEGTGLSTSILNTVQADADYFGLEALVTECKNIALKAEQKKVIEYIQVKGQGPPPKRSMFVGQPSEELIGVKINAALSQGYSLYGNLVLLENTREFLQAMVKYEQ